MQDALTELLASLTDVAVATSDTDGHIVMFSPGFTKILGDLHPETLDELNRLVPLYDEHQDHRLATLERPLTRATRGEIVRDLVATARHLDGTWRVLRFNAAPLRGPGDTIRGAMALVQDVTAEHRLRRYQAGIRDRLIATINHHFRTPLSLVLGHAEILEDFREDLPSDAQRSIDALTRGAMQLHNLTRAVSELVELADASDLVLARSDLCHHLRLVLTAQRPVAAEAGVTLRLLGPERLELKFDAVLIGRAVGALVRNAIQHAPVDSTVTVAVSASRAGALITVIDAGPGIPTDDRARLLQPFETGFGTNVASWGRGLGLALAHAIITAHGGTLTLTGNDPTGLCAELTIP